MYIDRQLELVKRLRAAGIVPVLVLEDVDTGLRLCELLQLSGLTTAEITFRTKAAAEIIAAAKKRFPDLLLGAGTVLNRDHLNQAFDLGAAFAVAPGFNPAIVKLAVDKNYPFSPGIATPSEVEQAHDLGVRLFKFFPAEALGGVAMLKNLIAPYKHLGLSFMPTGGVTSANFPDYLAVPEVAAVGGTWLGRAEDLKAGNWDKIGGDAKTALETLKKIRG
ncbi:MAG: bifunctional 4-hydroxy-2-oxoglutarate aldolase/2-dehydro-3-deoxy-phosphogluconate aldolase [Planctomycetota bacterium]|jgi:2-dehydro-3-deoxyphosphogluconate aldolase/(4S)-4-hydroxy-2-oxoglutarate aldolase|nr:bifunctional 4-hydroxy-2-oxoglutarate aldolase/2-dehydro-3-deoxy-phosphogluconate aldolase [Planctomycetota bacterium]